MRQNSDQFGSDDAAQVLTSYIVMSPLISCYGPLTVATDAAQRTLLKTLLKQASAEEQAVAASMKNTADTHGTSRRSQIATAGASAAPAAAVAQLRAISRERMLTEDDEQTFSAMENSFRSEGDLPLMLMLLPLPRARIPCPLPRPMVLVVCCSSSPHRRQRRRGVGGRKGRDEDAL